MEALRCVACLSFIVLLSLSFVFSQFSKISPIIRFFGKRKKTQENELKKKVKGKKAREGLEPSTSCLLDRRNNPYATKPWLQKLFSKHTGHFSLRIPLLCVLCEMNDGLTDSFSLFSFFFRNLFLRVKDH